MAPAKEVILKEGPAPKPEPKPASASSTPTKMPPHTATKRSPKKTDGQLLSGKRTPFKSPAKRKKTSPRKRKKADTEHDHLNTDDDGDEDDNTMDNQSQQATMPFVKIVGIDLGMWGHGGGRSSYDKDPTSVAADLTWRDSDSNQFKSPSIVAFKKDNPDHRAFRGKDHLVGFNVTPDMASCSFFKASLDKRPQATKFDNPILDKPIAKSLVSFSTPSQDEQAAIAVLKSLYDQEIENATAIQINFEEYTLENTRFVFVLTHPAACSKEGRDKIEALAKVAGLGSRRGDKVKLLSEAQAAAMACFISYRAEVKHDVWRIYFKKGEWITILDIGSLTVDTTTEEIISNDPRVKLCEKIVSEGGRCGTVSLHLHLLELIAAKFSITDADLPHERVGRGTVFHDECEHVLRTFTGNGAEAATILSLRLPDSVDHKDYDSSFEEVTLHAVEIKKAFDEWLVYPINIMLDQREKAEHQKRTVKTVIVCGGGSLPPYIWTTIRQKCQERGIKAVRPENPIAAVCRGAIISELSDGLLGQRLVRAHFGIKFERAGGVVMKWVVKRVRYSELVKGVADVLQGDIIDTTKPKMLESLAGHFAMGIEDVINAAAKFELKIFTYDRDDREVTDPNDPGIEEIGTIVLDKSSMSPYLQKKLTVRLESMDGHGRKQATLNVEVLLGVDESGRLYFQAKSGASSLGKEFLRHDFTKSCH